MGTVAGKMVKKVLLKDSTMPPKMLTIFEFLERTCLPFCLTILNPALSSALITSLPETAEVSSSKIYTVTSMIYLFPIFSIQNVSGF